MAAVVLGVSVLILTPYGHYMPPDFEFGFLRNKQSFFYSTGYFLGFYAHLASAPAAILIGTLQLSRSLRHRYPTVHRRLGQLYVALVLCAAAPGGAVMSMRAFGGVPSLICFALISTLAWLFTLIGWRKACNGDLNGHGRWMIRSFLMMSSAIVLRLVHILIQPLELDETLAYQISAWASWVPGLVVLEFAFYTLGSSPSPAGPRQATQ